MSKLKLSFAEVANMRFTFLAFELILCERSYPFASWLSAMLKLSSAICDEFIKYIFLKSFHKFRRDCFDVFLVDESGLIALETRDLDCTF